MDAVRPVKQFGVISTHSVLFFAPAASVFAGGSLMLLHVSREAFFFVSACMLAYANPVVRRGDLRAFYRRRAVSIVLPYACWTLIYWSTEISLPWRTGPELHQLLHLTLDGYYQLYYLLVIAQFYLLYPALIRAVRALRRHPVMLMAASALLQVVLVSLMHWDVLPGWMRGYWATREVTSYQLYLVAGCVAAAHLRAFETWLFAHVREIVAATVATAALAEAWLALAWYHQLSWLGMASDPFQPVVVPFNVAAILSLYALGRYLVSSTHSLRVRRWVRVGSDNAYGIFLAQMIFIRLMVDGDWAGHLGFLPWPVLVALSAVVVFTACWALSWLLSHTRLSRGLTGQRRLAWGRRAAPVTDTPIAALPATLG